MKSEATLDSEPRSREWKPEKSKLQVVVGLLHVPGARFAFVFWFLVCCCFGVFVFVF